MRARASAAAGSVVMLATGGARGRTLDLSTGGMRVQLAPGAVHGEVGDAVTLELHLDGQGATWLRFSGDVTRVADDGIVAIAFRAVPLGFAEVLRAEAHAGHAAAESRQVLLVDGDHARRAPVGAALRLAGCDVEEAATPLEAIAALGTGGARQWFVMIADTTSDAARELRAYVAEHHPRARLIPLASTDGAPTRAR